MPSLQQLFDEAVARTRKDPTRAREAATQQRLDDLYRRATEGDPQSREDAMRHYIELAGDLGQQDA
ncbi:MAG TPA: hypothetical protein VM491_21670 [Burkholderiaceae bacterium]|nr:hypothetical protein [Burkholderiaceae bacterium]